MKEQYREKSNKFYFSYSDDEGKGVDMNIQNTMNVCDVINEFEGFLRACGYLSVGSIRYDLPIAKVMTTEKESTIAKVAKNELMENKKEFDFSAIPNNNWLFGTQPIPTLTTADLTAISVTPTWAQQTSPNQFPTMAPITSEQIQSWSTEMPGTLGYPKVKF